MWNLCIQRADFGVVCLHWALLSRLWDLSMCGFGVGPRTNSLLIPRATVFLSSFPGDSETSQFENHWPTTIHERTGSIKKWEDSVRKWESSTSAGVWGGWAKGQVLQSNYHIEWNSRETGKEFERLALPAVSMCASLRDCTKDLNPFLLFFGCQQIETGHEVFYELNVCAASSKFMC